MSIEEFLANKFQTHRNHLIRRSAWSVQRKVRTSDVVTAEEMVLVVTLTRPAHHWLVFVGAFSLFTFFKDYTIVLKVSLLSLRSGGASKESKKYTDEIGDFEAELKLGIKFI